MASDRLYVPFTESVKNFFRKNADIEICTEGSFYTQNEDIKSLGVASIINFFGNVRGRFLIDMEKDLAFAVAKNMNEGDFNPENKNMALESVETLSKIIANNAIEELNSLYSAEIKAAPPIVLEGKDALITVPKVEPVSMDCTTSFGRFKINIAIEEDNTT
ncbi:MAG TPA: chemotaxis protein CheX [Acetivibrio sp.]|uniref:chemotaxis protein CheX n=1 Tax=Acetivibrio sp. TaxID=1872092 RepID=UPI002D1254EA|nr:chemotaxis protein CheX [Acetivibrio sp.]HOM02653.1 chemotaxis protein CheX [Acetivibrio sp.]